MNQQPEIKIIEWIDSSLQNGQVDKENFPKPVKVQSVGFIVEDSFDCVVLARDDMGNGDYRGLVAIPRFAIVEFQDRENPDRWD